jgi:hypothetical protein
MQGNQNNLNKSSIAVGLFTMTFAQIQVIEALIWRELENKNQQKANELARYIVPLLLSQPLINFLLSYYVTNDTDFLFLSLTYFNLFIKQTDLAFNVDKISVAVGPNGHLMWLRHNIDGESISLFGTKVNRILYMFGLLYPILKLKNSTMRIVLFLYAVMSCIYCYKTSTPKEYTSKWCYVAVGVPLVAITTNFALEYFPEITSYFDKIHN